MPQDKLLTTIDHQLSILNQPLTKAECAACLHLLALAGLPRAGIDGADGDAVHELYYRLLERNGVTARILRNACEAHITAPPKARGKFYPDPGEILALCRDDLSEKATKTKAMEKARQRLLELNGEASPAAQDLVPPGKLRSVAEILAANGLKNPFGKDPTPT